MGRNRASANLFDWCDAHMTILKTAALATKKGSKQISNKNAISLMIGTVIETRTTMTMSLMIGTVIETQGLAHVLGLLSNRVFY